VLSRVSFMTHIKTKNDMWPVERVVQMKKKRVVLGVGEAMDRR
jgi:hypothetical protein